MTEYDRQLIEQAKQIHYTEWYRILDLVCLAQTPGAKAILSDMAKELYHMEEFHSGIL